MVQGISGTGTEDSYLVVVIGPSGSGKSTFINTILGSDVAPVGSEVESCTDHIEEYCYALPSGKTVAFVDTPGFDGHFPEGKSLSREDVFGMVSDVASSRKPPISYVFFIQGVIGDGLMETFEGRAKRVFDALCSGSTGIVVITTFWDLASAEDSGSGLTDDEANEVEQAIYTGSSLLERLREQDGSSLNVVSFHRSGLAPDQVNPVANYIAPKDLILKLFGEFNTNSEADTHVEITPPSPSNTLHPGESVPQQAVDSELDTGSPKTNVSSPQAVMELPSPYQNHAAPSATTDELIGAENDDGRLSEGLAALQAEKDDLDRVLAEAQLESAQKDNDIIESLTREKDELSLRLRELSSIQAERDHASAESDQLRSRNLEMTQELRGIVASADEERACHSKELARIHLEKEETARSLAEAKSLLADKAAQLAKEREEDGVRLKEKTKELAALRAELDGLSADSELIRTQNQRLEHELKGALASIKEESARHAEERLSFQAEKENLEQELAEAKKLGQDDSFTIELMSELEDVRDERDALSTQCDELRKEKAKLGQDLKTALACVAEAEKLRPELESLRARGQQLVQQSEEADKRIFKFRERQTDKRWVAARLEELMLEERLTKEIESLAAQEKTLDMQISLVEPDEGQEEEGDMLFSMFGDTLSSLRQGLVEEKDVVTKSLVSKGQELEEAKVRMKEMDSEF
ncbi:hypothetical protein DFP72DRAFT_1166065 [Ephemerocybe angulata]|uniref:G domain-containing protein n=1 Tax=Ephemerocybe angulata TaxID=980116 RepID=A0A8H6IA82_9AGAR|nr:hypothetical protein DFP72DRAFT_1166065 [Tulosesus angulatus]